MVIIGLIIAVIVVGLFLAVVFLGKPTPGARFPVGSKAWEAELTMTALLPAIEQRVTEKNATANEQRRKRLDFEIQFLSKQVDELQAVIDRRDTSPGKGYIGFKAPPQEGSEA